MNIQTIKQLTSDFTAIVALFFVRKASNEMKDNVLRASGWRTVFIAVLTFIVLVFYIKTNRVATITTFVNIRGINVGHDLQGNVTDTASIVLFNHFASGITEKPVQNGNAFSDAEKGQKDVQAYIYISHREDYPFNILKTDSDNIQFSLNNCPFDKAYCYNVGILNTPLPRIFDVFRINFKIPDSVRNKQYYSESIHYTTAYNYDLFTNRFLRDSLFANSPVLWNPKDSSTIMILGSATDWTFASKQDTSMKTAVTGYARISTTGNKINFFSAADVSQYVLAVGINSSCPVKTLSVNYDLPIETEPLDSGMTIRTQGFNVRGKMLDEVRTNGVRFLVKMPTLSNLQLIRSLILTTLLTALISLLLLNFYYLFNKVYVICCNKYPQLADNNKVRQFRKKMIWPMIIILVIALASPICLLFDFQLQVSRGIYYVQDIVISVLIIAFVVRVYRSFRRIFKQ